MEEQTKQQFEAAIERLAEAAEALERVIGNIEAQQDELASKIGRIVAAVEEKEAATTGSTLEGRVADLEKANADLKAQATRLARRTLSPLTTSVLSKYPGEFGEKVDGAVVDKTLSSLSVDQRIAVKAEMARAGILE